jgi:AraC family transcriptional regulator
VNVTTWRRRERLISGWGVRDFYSRPLPEVYLFNFMTSRLELPPHGGSFSIKLAFAGEEEYFIGRRTLRVRPGSFLLVNGGETYGSRIRSHTHSLSLFYPDRDVASAQASLADDERRALDPSAAARRPAEVPQFICRVSAHSLRCFTALLASLRQRRQDAADEAAATLLLATLRDLSGSAPKLFLDGVRKPATRDELIGRVIRARDYVSDLRGRDCSLDRLAEVACLSKFHFLRLFRQVFGVSPAAFARARRLEEAARVIARGASDDFAAAAGGYASRHSLRRALGATGRGARQISNPG